MVGMFWVVFIRRRAINFCLAVVVFEIHHLDVKLVNSMLLRDIYVHHRNAAFTPKTVVQLLLSLLQEWGEHLALELPQNVSFKLEDNFLKMLLALFVWLDLVDELAPFGLANAVTSEPIWASLSSKDCFQTKHHLMADAMATHNFIDLGVLKPFGCSYVPGHIVC